MQVLYVCVGVWQAIGEAKSKQEEDRIIMDEMATLKTKMPTQVIIIVVIIKVVVVMILDNK